VITFDEKKKQCMEEMGADLGAIYSDLNDHLVDILLLWAQFEDLFGVDDETVQVLNRSASTFFGIVQAQFLDAVMLGISRLTDARENRSQQNLSIQAISPLVSDLKVRRQLNKTVDAALSNTKFARDHRNKRIAHSDLVHAQGRSAKPLPAASRQKIKDGLDSICAVLEVLNGHYRQSEFAYDMLSYGGGAASVVSLLRDGLKHQECET